MILLYHQLEKRELALEELREILQGHMIIVKLDEVDLLTNIPNQTMLRTMSLTMKPRMIMNTEKQKKLMMNLSFLKKNN